MCFNLSLFSTGNRRCAIGTIAAALALSLMPNAIAQDRDRDRDYRNGDRDRDVSVMTHVERGTVIPIRTNEAIDVERRSNRVYYGIVDRDVRGENGRIAIPRGANAELIVRVEPDNDLILDLESVVINGQRYAIRTDS